MEVICTNCGTKFNKLDRYVARSVRHFCNRSCAAKHNNVKFPKRKRSRRGKKTKVKCHCGSDKSYAAKQCHQCKVKQDREIALNTPIKDYFNIGNARVKYAAIRKWARKLQELYAPDKQCKVCSYDYHVDCCHIKDVSKFPDNALLGEVNAKENMVWLCKNHHWELDTGKLHMGG